VVLARDAGPAAVASPRPGPACDCEPPAAAALPRAPAGDASADYGPACGCRPAGS